MIGIPKKLAHIWIGPLKPPKSWMQTWPHHHQDWDYKIYGNDELNSRQWQCQPLIDEYMRRGEYCGVADIMRYEILLEQGGHVAHADTVCLRNMDHLFPDAHAYTVYENEFLRGKLVMPVLACDPGNPFVQSIVDLLKRKPPELLLEPWKSTGNMFVARLIETLDPEITIFPAYYMNPEHFDGLLYDGAGPIYSKEMFGTTRNRYAGKTWQSYFERRRIKKYRKQALREAYANTPASDWKFHMKGQKDGA